VGEDTAVQRGGAPDPEQVLDAAKVKDRPLSRRITS
jgi:hypothetical protein